MRAVTVLVVFCPCAFILATPTAVLAGIGNAAKYGIIIRSGNALEKLSKITRAAFDKTGTLTYGKMQVCGVQVLNQHVIARSEATKQSQKRTQPSDEIASPSASRVALNDDATSAYNDEAVFARSNESTLIHTDNNSATQIFVTIDKKIAGVISLSDTLREDAPRTIEKLKSAGVKPILLTGDNEAAAKAVASKCGITDVRSNLLPEEKLSAIKELSAHGEKVCMVGDGVNDALSLAASDAGIAMGGIGSDIAIEESDAVLVSDDIKRIPYLFSLTKKVMTKIKVNITAAMFINSTAVVLSALGILNPVTGALWHNCGSVFVVVNAAMLLRFKDKE